MENQTNADEPKQEEVAPEEVQAQEEETGGDAKVKEVQEDFKDKYYYLAAEMQNMQKRFEKEKAQLLKFGSETILSDLVDVIDNFERTLSFIRGDQDEKVKNIVVGIDMINKQFIESLEKHGLKQVNALGEIFDPEKHEALAQQADNTKKNMEVIQVHQEGYTLNGRLLRPAKVVVAKNEE